MMDNFKRSIALLIFLTLLFALCDFTLLYAHEDVNVQICRLLSPPNEPEINISLQFPNLIGRTTCPDYPSEEAEVQAKLFRERNDENRLKYQLLTAIVFMICAALGLFTINKSSKKDNFFINLGVIFFFVLLFATLSVTGLYAHEELHASVCKRLGDGKDVINVSLKFPNNMGGQTSGCTYPNDEIAFQSIIEHLKIETDGYYRDSANFLAILLATITTLLIVKMVRK
jgi:hypothetical protein